MIASKIFVRNMFLQQWPIPPKTKILRLSFIGVAGLTLAAYLMGCVKQSNTGNSVIEMHVNLLLH